MNRETTAAVSAALALMFRAVRLRDHTEACTAMEPLKPLVDAGHARTDDIRRALLTMFEDAGEPEGWAKEMARYLIGHMHDGFGSAFKPPPETIEPPSIDIRTGDPNPQVKMNRIADLIDQAESALQESRLGLFQRGGNVVRLAPVRDRDANGREIEVVRLLPVTEPHLSELMNDAARWERYDVRGKGYVSTRCPADLPRMYLARGGIGWRLPHLAGVIHAPTMRPDGSILDLPGYDGATRLYFDPRGEVFPEIPTEPDLYDAMAALAVLRELIEECAFIDRTDATVALSAILTAVVRSILPAAPAHAFTAPAPGTGKSYLASITARIATGRDAAGLAFSSDEAENRKQIDAALLEGRTALLFDNVTSEVSGARLSEVLTQPEITIRPLGRSETVTVPCAAMVLIDGNNLTVAADMTRRVLLSRLDRKVERPETHEFTRDPLAMIAADRGRYVAAALTILRAYYVAGRPNRPPALGSFGAWSDLVRGALLWLEQPDPADSIERVRANDPRRSELQAVLAHWSAAFGDQRTTTATLIETARALPDFREALLAVAGAAGAINTQRLGKWLRANVGKIADGMRLEAAPMRDGNRQWVLLGGPSTPAEPALAEMLA